MSERELRLIVWIDSVTDTEGWASVRDVASLHPKTIRSVGWVIGEGPKHVVLAMSHGIENEPDELEMCTERVAIPKIAILEDYELTEITDE